MKTFLVYYPDNGNREDMNTDYSYIAKADTKKEAIQKVVDHLNDGHSCEEFDADEHEVIE